MGIQQMLLAVGSALVPPPVFKIVDSVRLRSVSTAYFSQTFGAPTNQNIWTYDGWHKRGKLAALQHLFDSGAANTSEWAIRFDAADKLQIVGPISGGFTTNKVTAAVFRDPSAWYHIHVEWNMTLATAERCKLWINGAENTTWTTNTGPTANSSINSAVVHRIGNDTSLTLDMDGFVAAQYFVDGQNVAVTSFGEFNSAGVWIPKAYTGTYGANGFHLNFANKATANDLGLDSSGNANNWTATGISVTAGPTYDPMKDTPSDNYCTWNPIDRNLGTTSDGNLKMAGATSTGPQCRGTIGVSSGKWYVEFTQTLLSGDNGLQLGFSDTESRIQDIGLAASKNVCYYAFNGNKIVNGVSTAYGPTYTTNDVIGCALDLDNLTCQFFKALAATPTVFVAQPLITGLAFAELTIMFYDRTSTGSPAAVVNCGQQPFWNPAIPAGFKALSTANMQPPAAPIASGAFTGNASADGPFIWTGGVPLTLNIDGSANLVGTAGLDVTAGGFKLRSATNNAAGTRSWTATYDTPSTDNAFAQPQPAQKNP